MSRLASSKITQIWAARIALCERSNAPVAQFCQSIGCSPTFFFQWKRKTAAKPQTIAILRVQTSESNKGHHRGQTPLWNPLLRSNLGGEIHRCDPRTGRKTRGLSPSFFNHPNARGLTPASCQAKVSSTPINLVRCLKALYRLVH
jgi:hypothetical protein